MIKLIQMRNGEERHLERKCRGFIEEIMISAINVDSPDLYEEYTLQLMNFPGGDVLYEHRITEGLTFHKSNLYWAFGGLCIRINSPKKTACSFTISLHYMNSQPDLTLYREEVAVSGFVNTAEIDRLAELIGSWEDAVTFVCPACEMEYQSRGHDETTQCPACEHILGTQIKRLQVKEKPAKPQREKSRVEIAVELSRKRKKPNNLDIHK